MGFRFPAVASDPRRADGARAPTDAAPLRRVHVRGRLTALPPQLLTAADMMCRQTRQTCSELGNSGFSRATATLRRRARKGRLPLRVNHSATHSHRLFKPREAHRGGMSSVQHG